MKLIIAAFTCAAAGWLAFALNALPPSARALPGPRLNALQRCRFGGLELIDERCDATGACAKQSVRLAWDRGAGVLFEGDSTGEQEQRRIGAPELSRLLAELTGLKELETDADQPWWRGLDGCAGAERALTITTDCAGAAGTYTFLRAKPVWERVRDARSECDGPWSPQRAQCAAQRTWRAALATHLAVRFGTVFHRLRDAGR